ncbi:bifunctional 2-polyprenyl-6-hydroxyphenol methylase/3-demethylubiquinol 3-O-methyltransferase UbiG [Paenibacillus sp. Mc5Re-14]|uniref:class I SAM-dependent methyltransferase n=1 Tax=Paenibacillus sp. Mc5Re-14 TaxID=1030529 RepID=UPI000A5B8FE2|nr:methyltransferase [Paenibacillus sp. Mc5Re-14]
MTKSYHVEEVYLNMEFAPDDNLYSDGEVEDRLLDIFKNGQDYNSILEESNEWALLYHLSEKRHNLLNWYEFEKKADILEIGAGCGAVTELFVKKEMNVTSIEYSHKRALINAYRNKNAKNLEIIVGDFNDIHLEKKYDYITLIGVFEYSGLISKGKYTTIDFLENIKNLLKPGGQLIIAIENKLGFKYWAGAVEDHLGKLFLSIEGYDRSKGIETYSKQELVTLLNRSGFVNTKFYYPVPDYKFCSQIFSDNYLPRIGQVNDIVTNYDSPRVSYFNAVKSINNIINSRYFDVFSNSFLIFSKLS